MKIQHIALLSLSTALSSCITGTGSNCGDDISVTDQISDVTDAQLNRILEEFDSSSEITCEALCLNIQYLDTVIECSDDVDREEWTPSEGEGDAAYVVGTVTCSGTETIMCEGRRPIGYCESDGSYYAKCANLEGASILAFLQLEKQLQEWNAPQELQKRCRQAAKEELQHTAMMTRLAQKNGEQIPVIQIAQETFDLLQTTQHNAVEGCVWETWAGIEALLKSKFAKTKELRRMYAEIASDELRHAQLAWDLHTWFCSQLSETQQAHIAQAQRKAIAKLKEQAIARWSTYPIELGLQDIPNTEKLLETFINGLAA